MKQRVYLDHAATTPVRREVLEAMLPFFTERGYNPSSLHAEGRAARSALDDARDRVAALIGAGRKEVIFTGSGTEADNHAIRGVAHLLRERGRHVISTAIEHHAVLRSLDALTEEGFDVTLLPVDERGLVDPEQFAAALRDDTILASVMLANNEIGVVQPIAQLAAIARRRGVVFHTDAVQAGEWIALRPAELGVDLLALSAHKFYGPKGVGMLYVREGLPLGPLIHGGGQEFGRRSGTENVAGIVGLARALELAHAGLEERVRRIGALRHRLEEVVLREIEDARVNGAGAPRLPNISNISFAGVGSDGLLLSLDLAGIAASAGSACTSGVLEPSHVIAALGVDPRWHQGVVRFSLGDATTREQVERLLGILPRLVAQLRGNEVAVRKAR
jgi:cysteine desulfurase